MSAYIVSWGVTDGDNYIECDSIVHETLEAAREEFDLLKLDEAVSGAVAQAALERGWTKRGTLTQIEMLDEENKPTDNVEKWVYEGERELLAEK